jgi:alanyl-tRNA synthetase
VLRRIMRRAMRHAQLLGSREPIMWRLVPALTREMGPAYPELLRAEALITETLRLEETRFRTTLARGLAILEDETRDFGPGASLAGEVAFKLYDTYGFPIDLTQDALRGRNIGVDTEGFAKAMERQRAEARKAWAGSGEAATETLWFDLKEWHGATEFLGYDTELAEGVVVAILKDGAEIERLKTGESGTILLNQTPFYGESGGQVGDTGLMLGADARFRVTNTQKKLGDLFIHEGLVEAGEIELKQPLELIVDHSRRTVVRANHSATHLLHEALRRVLGDHVAQKGSLVAQDRLRFDFAHPKPISDAELLEIEDIANQAILANTPVVTRLMAADDAITSGARALFGEKYGDEVRVVSMGPADAVGEGHPFSTELCGGTHVARTGDIGLLTIVSESAVASGVRRIEAKTGAAARHHLNEEARRLHDLTQLLKTPADSASDRLAALIEERRKLERELSEARKKLAMGGGQAGAAPIQDVNGVQFLGRVALGVETKDLKSLADDAKQTVKSGVVALVGVAADGKAGVVIGVTADLTARFDAVALVRIAAQTLGGKGGGGRRDLAQAGGPDGAAAEAALSAVADALREMASAA